MTHVDLIEKLLRYVCKGMIQSVLRIGMLMRRIGTIPPRKTVPRLKYKPFVFFRASQAVTDVEPKHSSETPVHPISVPCSNCLTPLDRISLFRRPSHLQKPLTAS